MAFLGGANVYGLEAINYANGWAMAGVGATIVVTGLSVLSCLISQLHRLVDFFEVSNTVSEAKVVDKDDKVIKESVPEKLSNKLDEASQIYMLFTSEQLGDSFQLTDLYRLSNDIGLPHPHISIRNFRDSGILIPLGKGLFSWKPTPV